MYLEIELSLIKDWHNQLLSIHSMKYQYLYEDWKWAGEISDHNIPIVEAQVPAAHLYLNP